MNSRDSFKQRIVFFGSSTEILYQPVTECNSAIRVGLIRIPSNKKSQSSIPIEIGKKGLNGSHKQKVKVTDVAFQPNCSERLSFDLFEEIERVCPDLKALVSVRNDVG
jgi:hypothetical protein